MTRRALDPDGLNLFVANGEVGGQTVFHVHVHSIPRWADDAWIDPWSPAPVSYTHLTLPTIYSV